MNKAPRKPPAVSLVPAGAPTTADDALFARIVTILEEARSRVVRAVNSEMVLAYWHIGREIVEEVQRGEERADYGDRVLDGLSSALTARFGAGFSVTNLRYFRLFYHAYASRTPHIHRAARDELAVAAIHHTPSDVSERLAWAVEHVDAQRGFLSELSWTHYRVLCGVEHRAERLFLEMEAAQDQWTVRTLERQVHTHLFLRLLKSRDKDGVIALASKGQQLARPIDAMRDPYVLDFLALPEPIQLHESRLEAAIIGHIQEFLLELGKGFAFVSRQRRLQYDGEHLYVDLVFYNVVLKCYLLIDLKMGKLTHQDVGQMDSYVRLYDHQHRTEGDNPTIGLILCTERNEAVARYSVLHGSEQIFAARYLTLLPTVEQLEAEIQRERLLIESGQEP